MELIVFHTCYYSKEFAFSHEIGGQQAIGCFCRISGVIIIAAHEARGIFFVAVGSRREIEEKAPESGETDLFSDHRPGKFGA